MGKIWILTLAAVLGSSCASKPKATNLPADTPTVAENKIKAAEIKLGVKRELIPTEEAFRHARLYISPVECDKLDKELHTNRIHLRGKGPLLLKTFDRGADKVGFLCDINRDGKLSDEEEIIAESIDGVYSIKLDGESEFPDFYFKVTDKRLKAAATTWIIGNVKIGDEVYRVAFVDRSMNQKHDKLDALLIGAKPLVPEDMDLSFKQTFGQEEILINEVMYSAKISFETPSITFAPLFNPTSRITVDTNFKKTPPNMELSVILKGGKSRVEYRVKGSPVSGVKVPAKKYRYNDFTLSVKSRPILIFSPNKLAIAPYEVIKISLPVPTIESFIKQEMRILIVATKINAPGYKTIVPLNYSDGKIKNVTPLVHVARKSTPDVIIASAKTQYGWNCICVCWVSMPKDVKAGETLVITTTLDTGDLYGILKTQKEFTVE